MSFGLKNRLRLISFFHILIFLPIIGYVAYESFIKYQVAQTLQDKLSTNRQLDKLLGSISKERAMTLIYLASSSVNNLKSLRRQRKVLDGRSEFFLLNRKNGIDKLIQKIKNTRLLVDKKETNFNDIYNNIYGKAQDKIIIELESLIDNQTDTEIKELFAAYISLVHSKKFTFSERDFITYNLTRSRKLTMDELSLWISFITKSEISTYDKLQNQVLIQALDTIFEDKKFPKLRADINRHRSNLISLSSSNSYTLSPAVWFKMLSKKIDIISAAEDNILLAMDNRAKQVQIEVLQLFAISLIVWILFILVASLGVFLSKEIQNNIKSLQSIIDSVTVDTEEPHKIDSNINLQTAAGMSQGYKLLQTIIQQTTEDKIFAQEASEAKSLFLANMSHEIRTPLNGIVGFTELLKDSGLEEEQGEFVDIIEKSSENLLEIINNILDLSKIESNKLEIEDIAFSPIGEFESAVEIYAVRASEKDIDLGCFIDPRLEQSIKGDPTKIKEIIINLLSNAVKFTNNSGTIDINIRRLNSPDPKKIKIKFEVQDNGIGVTGEQKSRIFEAFSQADTSITRKYGGTGLGLTISSKFVELMGGQLDLDSKLGKGSKFFFTIDFEKVEPFNESCKGNFSKINVLILEDSNKQKKQDGYLREYLDFFGVSHVTFKNKEELIELKSQLRYDLLFIDYEYCSQEDLIHYSKESEELIVMTKATYMKNLDSLNLNIFKTLYEPLNNTKIKALLNTFHTQKFQVAKNKKIKHKKFDMNTSKFHANILIAEDNIINQKLIKRTLESIGLNITIANNGLEAFQKRKDGNFDLVFMDIQMPFLNGIESTKEILEYEKDYNQVHIPIIALTANALKGDRERFLAEGLDEYTTKPLVRSEIISLLNHFLSDYIVEIEEIPKDKSQVQEEVIIEEKIITTIKVTPEIEKIELLDTVEEVKEVLLTNTYKADILLAKKSSFESKLFARLLDSLNYTYDIAHSHTEIDNFVDNATYKVILLDKECKELNLLKLSKNVQDSINKTALKTKLILIVDPLTTQDEDDNLYVQEIIKNVVNKDLLKTVLEKFI